MTFINPVGTSGSSNGLTIPGAIRRDPAGVAVEGRLGRFRERRAVLRQVIGHATEHADLRELHGLVAERAVREVEDEPVAQARAARFLHEFTVGDDLAGLGPKDQGTADSGDRTGTGSA